MKKPILPIVLIVGLLAGVSSAVTIPRASVRQISAAPLSRGETTYVEMESSSGEKYAEMYIGGEVGPLRVADSSALRGYKLRTLEPSEYSVSASAGWTYNVAAGTYTATQVGQTNAIMVTAKDGVVIEEVKIEREVNGTSEMDPTAGIYYAKGETSGNVFRWAVAFRGGSSLVVSKITVTARSQGEVEWVNDTEKIKFTIIDALGRYDLYDLRKYLLHYYDGNRGEDWSKYKAVKPVRMDGQAVRFTDDNRFTMSVGATSNLVLQASMKDAMEVNVRTNGAAISYTTFQITGIDCGSGVSGNPVALDFTCDIANFSAANIGVCACDKLEDGVWLGLPSADYTVSNISTANGFTSGTVTVTHGVKADRRFFKLLYGAATSDVIDIVLHGRVIVKDILIIKGTDSKFYQINVNGGTISATEVSL